MARLEDMPESAEHLLALPCPRFDSTPWAEGPPIHERRVAILSTAGLHERGDSPFSVMDADYRVIGPTTEAKALVMSHISTNFDRTGFQQDIDLVFPLDRLHDLAGEGVIGSVADFHYSFMGATDPREMEDTAREVAALLRGDGVTAVFLVPV
jgi:D-proline reductase (dithiol) PrdB